LHRGASPSLRLTRSSTLARLHRPLLWIPDCGHRVTDKTLIIPQCSRRKTACDRCVGVFISAAPGGPPESTAPFYSHTS